MATQRTATASMFQTRDGLSIDRRRSELVGTGPDGQRTPVWEPATDLPTVATLPTTDLVLQHQREAQANVSAELEAELIGVLTRPLGADESHQTGNANREQEMLQIIERLTRAEAFFVRRRLELQRADDVLCRAFARLTPERRGRLLAALRAFPSQRSPQHTF